MGVVFVVVVLAVSLAPKKTQTPTGADRPRVVFGSQVQAPSATSRLIYTNGWKATSAQQSIGVFAGRQSASPRNGLFVILRQARNGHRRLVDVVVRGSGSVTLLRPTTPASEQQAFTETLHFITANGATGTLDLSGDSVKLGD
jgi:hypothetical protein